MARSKRKMLHGRPLTQRQISFGLEGRYFDLQAVFDKLKAKYFPRKLSGYTITWGRRRRLPPRDYFVFGTIQEEERLIRIHPLLDQRFVPRWFLEYVVYHEMLHSVVPDRYDENGRRIIHHDEFNRREQKFPHYRRARKWEEENLTRFLR